MAQPYSPAPMGAPANSIDHFAVTLDCRGSRLTLDHTRLMELPESVLLCLFPNGVNLGAQRAARADDDGMIEDDEPELYFVDFDAECLDFILSFFNNARDTFYGPPEGPHREFSDAYVSGLQNPLLYVKQAIIVLREELEYFALPPRAGKGDDGAVVAKTDEKGRPNEALVRLKHDCADALLSRKSIFTALQRNINRENNLAEQHLIDMLCMSGFERDDEWGYRALEPGRCCIASIALVLLKTGITHPPIAGSSTEGSTEHSDPAQDVQVNPNQLATAQKLLLFWRKPARKCWWDALDLTLHEGTDKAQDIRIWARRVWTLELALI